MINTYSIFYWADNITSSNQYLNFDEGGGELTATIENGEWTPTELAQKVEDALNTAGALTYTVTFDRDTQFYTISATGNFSLLVSTGSQAASSIFGSIGFTGADTASDSEHTSNTIGINSYEPQFKLQSYVSTDDLQKSVSETINKSANGDIKVIKFGIEKFMECNISFINDYDQGEIGPIKNNATGVSDARSFMQFAVSKSPIEFMADIDDRDIYQKFILESTSESQNGTGYRLTELYTKNLPGYYETGKLVFRLVE